MKEHNSNIAGSKHVRRLRRTPVAFLILMPLVLAAGCKPGDPTEWSCQHFQNASAEEKRAALSSLRTKWFNDPKYKGQLGHFRAGNNMSEPQMEAVLGRLIADECAKRSKGHRPAHPALQRLADSEGQGDLPPEAPAATPAPAPPQQGTTAPGPGAQAPSDQAGPPDQTAVAPEPLEQPTAPPPSADPDPGPPVTDPSTAAAPAQPGHHPMDPGASAGTGHDGAQPQAAHGAMPHSSSGSCAAC